MSKNVLKVAAVQMEANERDKDINLSLMESYIEKASSQNVDIIAFPEICITGYNFVTQIDTEELLEVAELVPEGPSTQRLLKSAKEKNINILFGLVEKDSENKIYNTYVTVKRNGEVYKFRKIHAWENSAMTMGNEFPIFDIEGWKTGTLICYDNNLPENQRVYSLNGAEILFAPHQTGAFDIDRKGMGRISLDLWNARKENPEAIEKEILGPKGREWIMKWLPCRAYDNNMYMVFTNGVGIDGSEVRTGNVAIVDPDGIVMAESKKADNDMIIAEMRRDELDGSLGKMHMATRRPGLYADLVNPKFASGEDSREARNKMTADHKCV